MPMKRPKLHPACKIFPPLGEDDLQELADDIAANGLRNPIVLYQGKILDGRNRWDACKLAGVDPQFRDFEGDDPLSWVISQNLTRRHLTASQRAVIALDLLPLLEQEAKDRQRLSQGRGKKGRKNLGGFPENGEAAEHAARITRSNAKYVRSVKQIKEQAPELIEKIRTGDLTVVEAQRLATIDQQREKERHARRGMKKQRTWRITAEQKVVKCDALIADPPYGITQEPWEPNDLETFTKTWCSRWAKCGADFIAIFWSQGKLLEGRSWFDESLEGYRFQQLLIWHASNNVAHKDRKCFKQTWEPIFLYRRIGSDRKVISPSKTWDTERHNGDCFVAAIPQTVYNGEDFKQHPCQKPVSVMRWLIHALTEVGDLVVSPFCGVAPCGIAATQVGRRYHGIEVSQKYRKIGEERIAAYGMDAVSIKGGRRSRLNGNR